MLHKLFKEIPRAFLITVSIFIVLVLIKWVTGITIELNKNLAINFGYTMLYGFSLYFGNAFLFMYLVTTDV